MLHQNSVASDALAIVMSSSIILSVLRLFEETAKRGLFDQKLNRKLVHVSVGLVFMLCWPLFSSGQRGALLAATSIGINIIRMLLVGAGIWKDEATVKSMSRFGIAGNFLKGRYTMLSRLHSPAHITGGLHQWQLQKYATSVLEMV
ncbi:hypothetical protein BT93_I0411 [Corymbia citriodora subsp. variegata]|nr:hypothetical protein BT93_I0411 [Corymbia citriodora subsp. variegata]